jgi:hypothetical protein
MARIQLRQRNGDWPSTREGQDQASLDFRIRTGEGLPFGRGGKVANTAICVTSILSQAHHKDLPETLYLVSASTPISRPF